MRKFDVDAVRAVLNAMRDSLIGQSRDTLIILSQDTISCPDATDRATVETDRQLALLMRERDRQVIEEIQAALNRMDDGEYGICQECGEEIGLARLRAQPTATLCVHCKSMMEAIGQGAMLRARAESAFMEE